MSDDPATDEFLTVDEVAAMLKLVPQTVRNWIFSIGSDVSP